MTSFRLYHIIRDFLIYKGDKFDPAIDKFTSAEIPNHASCIGKLLDLQNVYLNTK